jgi:hypothetical protein
MSMTREELVAMRDVIDALLRCPDHVRELLTQWIAPEARRLAPEARSRERTVPLIFSKPNGRDPHPPPIATLPEIRHPPPAKARETERPAPEIRRPAPPPISAKAHEQRLLTALQEHSGASVNVLAKAASASRSRTGERLRGLARAGKVAKDGAGHWRLVAELAGEPAGPTSAPSN